MGVPLLFEGLAIGVVVVQTYERGQLYSEQDLDLLTFVGQHIASALTRARAIAETKQRAAELAIVNRVGQAIAAQLDPDELVQLVGEQVRETMNADIAYVAMHDAERGMIDFPYYYEREPGEGAGSIPYGDGWTSRVLITRKPLLVSSKEERESVDTPGIGTPVQSYLGVPIVVGDESIGVIAVQSTSEEGRFSASHERLLSTIAAGVGSAVQNSRLYGETRRLYAEAREYLEQVDKVTTAAVALEAGEFSGDSLSAVAERPDALGQLARTFTTMAVELAAREARLREQVQELRIEIDQRRQREKVAEITGTDYFKDLRSRADDLRAAARHPDIEER
jgi:GAF domain-containing protein